MPVATSPSAVPSDQQQALLLDHLQLQGGEPISAAAGLPPCVVVARPNPGSAAGLASLPVAVLAVVISFLDANTTARLRLTCRSLAGRLRDEVAFGAALAASALGVRRPQVLQHLLATHDGSFRRSLAHALPDVRWCFAGAPLGPTRIDRHGSTLRAEEEEEEGRDGRAAGRRHRHQQRYSPRAPLAARFSPSVAHERMGQPVDETAPPICCSGPARPAALTVLPASAACCFSLSRGGHTVRVALPPKLRVSSSISSAASLPLHGRWLRVRATGPGLPVLRAPLAGPWCGGSGAGAGASSRGWARHVLTVRLSGVQRAFVGVCSDRFDPVTNPTAERWTYASNGTISDGTAVANSEGSDSAAASAPPFADCVLRICLDLAHGVVSFTGGDLENSGVLGLRLQQGRALENSTDVPLGCDASSGPQRGKAVRLYLPEVSPTATATEESHQSCLASARRYYFLFGVFFTRHDTRRPTVAEIISYKRGDIV